MESEDKQPNVSERPVPARTARTILEVFPDDKVARVSYPLSQREFNVIRDFFYSLKARYPNIGVPSMEPMPVPGEPSKDAAFMKPNKRTGDVCVLTDAVHGQNLEEIGSFEREDLDTLDSFYADLIRSVSDSYDANAKKGRRFFNFSQLNYFIYGYANGNSKKRVFVNELDPGVIRNWGENGMAAFEFSGRVLRSGIEKLEAKFPPGIIFEKSRAALAELQMKAKEVELRRKAQIKKETDDSLFSKK